MNFHFKRLARFAPTALISLLAVSALAEPTEALYSCKYFGDRYCPEGGICIGSANGRQTNGDLSLQLDLGIDRVELQGLKGILVRDSTGMPEAINWLLPGLGKTRISFRKDDKFAVVYLWKHGEQMSSEFICEVATASPRP